jgi:hypothetical protein
MLLLILHLKQPSRRPRPHCIASSKPTRPSPARVPGVVGGVLAAGANLKEVAARAGHASVSFTLDRYGHLYPEADTALHDRLDVL